MAKRSRLNAFPGPVHGKPALRATHRRSLYQPAIGHGARGGERLRHRAFIPPETWHEPGDVEPGEYRIVVQPPGAGFRHVVTPDEIRRRLSHLPDSIVRELEVVQLSGMTRKKRRLPCYGMQWGRAVYLYPLPEDLVEWFGQPPRPAQRIEVAKFGGRWDPDTASGWKLTWTEAAAREFYLNNILLHELGHLLDGHNTAFADRERYAEWFATQLGRVVPARRAHHRKRSVIRRHHHKR